MDCVQEFLKENHIYLDSSDTDQPVQKPPSNSALLTLAASQLYNSVLAEPPTDPASKAWIQNVEAAEGASPANCFFRSCWQNSPMQPLHSSWQPSSKLGFDIWDLKRMCTLELMDVPREVPNSGGPYRVGVGIRMSPGHMQFTWRSIEDWEKVPNGATSAEAANPT